MIIKYKIMFLLFLALIGLIINANAQEEETINHVVIIGVDGMRPDALQIADTPVMDQLIIDGSYSFHGRAVMPTSSSPNWASLLMGAGPEQHGITSNGWSRDNHELPPITKNEAGIFPSIFGIIKEEIPHATMGAFISWGGIASFIDQNAMTAIVDGVNSKDSADQAVAFIMDQLPLLTFVHLNNPDNTGHQHGYSSQPYYNAITQTDSYIGDIINALKTAEIFENTLIIITSDHGGIGNGHGGSTLAEVEIPIILHGPHVKQGYEITDPINIYDIAATTAYALNIDQPQVWIAKPIETAFYALSDRSYVDLNY